MKPFGVLGPYTNQQKSQHMLNSNANLHIENIRSSNFLNGESHNSVSQMNATRIKMPRASGFINPTKMQSSSAMPMPIQDINYHTAPQIISHSTINVEQVQPIPKHVVQKYRAVERRPRIMQPAFEPISQELPPQFTSPLFHLSQDQIDHQLQQIQQHPMPLTHCVVKRTPIFKRKPEYLGEPTTNINVVLPPIIPQTIILEEQFQNPPSEYEPDRLKPLPPRQRTHQIFQKHEQEHLYYTTMPQNIEKHSPQEYNTQIIKRRQPSESSNEMPKEESQGSFYRPLIPNQDDGIEVVNFTPVEPIIVNQGTRNSSFRSSKSYIEGIQFQSIQPIFV